MRIGCRVTTALALLILPVSAEGVAEPLQVLCSATPSPNRILQSDYCTNLRAMHEPSVPAADHPDSYVVFRFLWFRSFHPPVIVRIDEKRDGTGVLTLHAVRTIASEGAHVSRQTDTPIDTQNDLTDEQVAAFDKLVARESFWTLPSQFHLEMDFGPFATHIPKEQEIVV